MTDEETIKALRDEIEWLDAQIAAARSMAITGMHQAGSGLDQDHFHAIVLRLSGVRSTTSARKDNAE